LELQTAHSGLLFLQACQFRFSSKREFPQQFATVAHHISQSKQQRFDPGKRLKLPLETAHLTSRRKHVTLQPVCNRRRLCM
jgi:outer membrane lipopolysaccharide assembly protein LptE/RlpB